MSASDQSASVAMVLAADLGCALCRKRTGETGTRLCQACGLPVHLSCAQHVAARECGLEFGFPLPSVFCSKRCYDAGTDPLGNSANNPTDPVDELSMAPAGKRWSPQVPNEVTAALTLKIGDVTRTSRKHLSITTFRFLLTEGFDVFKAKVNSRAAKELQNHALETFVREDAAIYIRPGVHSKQAELVELSDKNFETRIRKTFRNFLKRKATQSGDGASEQFECDVYVYVKKESAAARRRAGRDTTVAAATTTTNASASANGRTGGGGVKMLSGLAAQHHFMLQQQQQLQQQLQPLLRVHANGDVVDVADSATSVDALMTVPGSTKRRLSELTDEAATPVGYKSIRMVLNGAVVPVKVHVGDLLAALGLPTTAPHALQGPSSDAEGGAASGSSLNGDC